MKIRIVSAFNVPEGKKISQTGATIQIIGFLEWCRVFWQINTEVLEGRAVSIFLEKFAFTTELEEISEI